MEEFEQELRQELRRQAAPAGLKGKIRSRRHAPSRPSHAWVWQRIAAVLVLAAAAGGGFEWRHREEVRKGEEARQQVMIALRVTSQALDRVHRQLAAHDRAHE